jgi:hypothetical protein
VASSWLAPSYPTRPCDLPVQKTRDASNRRLPPKRLACTRISCAPGSSHDFHRVDTPQSLRLCAVVPGDQTVHAAWTASADCPSHNGDAVRLSCLPRAFCLTAFPTRAWAFSSHGVRFHRASDIPVASSRSPRRASRFRGCLLRSSSCWACVRSDRDGEAAKLAFHAGP